MKGELVNALQFGTPLTLSLQKKSNKRCHISDWNWKKNEQTSDVLSFFFFEAQMRHDVIQIVIH